VDRSSRIKINLNRVKRGLHYNTERIS